MCAVSSSAFLTLGAFLGVSDAVLQVHLFSFVLTLSIYQVLYSLYKVNWEAPLIFIVSEMI